MKRFFCFLALLLLVFATPVVLGRQIAAQGGDGTRGPAIENLSGCGANIILANDDHSTLASLSFTLNFFGTNYSSLYVNTNGNVTFGSALSSYIPVPLVSTSHVIIAPFFADVDTRGLGNGLVTYGSATYSGHSTFCVNWPNVGYYQQHTDKLNNFQLLLIDRSDVGQGDFDIMMNYSQIQWEAGDSSGGVGGLGGVSARAGYSNGSTVSFELPGSASNGTFLDSDMTTGLIHNSVNSPQLGRYVFQVRGGVPQGTTGLYLKCAADIQQSGKALDAHALCYFDSASMVNNRPGAGFANCPPADPKFCGDGIRGGAPPGCAQDYQVPSVSCKPLPAFPPSRPDCANPVPPNNPLDIPCTVSQYQYLHVDKAAHLLGVLNNSTNNYELYGCLEDPHGHQALGAVYIEIMTISQAGKGSATIWPNQANATCVTAATNHSAAGLSGPPETAVVDVVVDNPGTKPAPALCGGVACRDSDNSGPCTPATCLDSDGDGCYDKDELSGTALQGGHRDPQNPFDYPDTPALSHTIRINDVTYVINRFRHDMNGPVDQVPAYDPKADHTTLPGSNEGEFWHLGPPNGQIRIADVTTVINSFRHDCN